MIAPDETLKRLLGVKGMEPARATPFLTDEPKLPVYVTRLGEHSWGQGAHPDPVVAQLKAAGEALERHCLLTPDGEPSVMARFGDLEGQIDPVDFFCYSEEQVADYNSEVERVRGAEYHWTPVQTQGSDQRLLVPREFIYIDAGDLEQRRIRRESTSSGAALGTAGTGDAFRGALFELVERDAFISAWLTNRPLVRIGSLGGVNGELLSWLEKYRLDCRVFDLRGSLGVPVVLALTLDRSGVGPAVTSGLGAAESYEDAMTSAILESVSYRRQARLHMMSNDLPQVELPEDIVSVETRIAYWSQTQRLDELPAWVDGPSGVMAGDLEAISCSSHRCVSKLTERGCRVLSADIATPATRAKDFEAIRVIIPELHSLYLSEAAKSLISAHVGTIPMNGTLLPHPFA